MKKHISGFTLIELLITLAVAGVLLSLAVPGFTTLIKNNRITTQANTCVTAFALARSEAIRRGSNIQIKPNGTDWSSGMEITDSSDQTIRLFNISSSTVTLASTATAITYLPTGMVDITGGGSGGVTSFTVCDDRTDGAYGRLISIAATGRVSSEKYSGCGGTG